jgi:hypothetical protein
MRHPACVAFGCFEPILGCALGLGSPPPPANPPHRAAKFNNALALFFAVVSQKRDLGSHSGMLVSAFSLKRLDAVLVNPVREVRAEKPYQLVKPFIAGNSVGP